MDRRTLLQAALAGFVGSRLSPLASPAHAQDAPAVSFSFDNVIARARAVAAEPYRRPLMKLTAPFAELMYDLFRGIRFRE